MGLSGAPERREQVRKNVSKLSESINKPKKNELIQKFIDDHEDDNASDVLNALKSLIKSKGLQNPRQIGRYLKKFNKNFIKFIQVTLVRAGHNVDYRTKTKNYTGFGACDGVWGRATRKAWGKWLKGEKPIKRTPKVPKLVKAPKAPTRRAKAPKSVREVNDNLANLRSSDVLVGVIQSLLNQQLNGKLNANQKLILAATADHIIKSLPAKEGKDLIASIIKIAKENKMSPRALATKIFNASSSRNSGRIKLSFLMNFPTRALSNKDKQKQAQAAKEAAKKRQKRKLETQRRAKLELAKRNAEKLKVFSKIVDKNGRKIPVTGSDTFKLKMADHLAVNGKVITLKTGSRRIRFTLQPTTTGIHIGSNNLHTLRLTVSSSNPKKPFQIVEFVPGTDTLAVKTVMKDPNKVKSVSTTGIKGIRITPSKKAVKRKAPKAKIEAKKSKIEISEYLLRDVADATDIKGLKFTGRKGNQDNFTFIYKGKKLTAKIAKQSTPSKLKVALTRAIGKSMNSYDRSVAQAKLRQKKIAERQRRMEQRADTLAKQRAMKVEQVLAISKALDFAGKQNDKPQNRKTFVARAKKALLITYQKAIKDKKATPAKIKTALSNTLALYKRNYKLVATSPRDLGEKALQNSKAERLRKFAKDNPVPTTRQIGSVKVKGVSGLRLNIDSTLKTEEVVLSFTYKASDGKLVQLTVEGNPGNNKDWPTFIATLVRNKIAESEGAIKKKTEKLQAKIEERKKRLGVFNKVLHKMFSKIKGSLKKHAGYIRITSPDNGKSIRVNLNSTQNIIPQTKDWMGKGVKGIAIRFYSKHNNQENIISLTDDWYLHSDPDGHSHTPDDWANKMENKILPPAELAKKKKFLRDKRRFMSAFSGRLPDSNAYSVANSLTLKSNPDTSLGVTNFKLDIRSSISQNLPVFSFTYRKAGKTYKLRVAVSNPTSDSDQWPNILEQKIRAKIATVG